MRKQELLDLYDQYKNVEDLRIQLAIHMPDGSTESIYNTKAHNKMEYIDKTYNDNLVHKNSDEIYIIDAVFYFENDVNFATALFQARLGWRITRRAWGENVWVYYVPRGNYTPVTDAAKKNLNESGKVPYGAYLAIKTQSGMVYPFTPGVDSILANDWMIIK